MAKCGDCGWLIHNAGVGCVNPKCIPGVRKDARRSTAKKHVRGRYHEDTMKNRRCPFCTGAQHASGKPCWLSACDRGPNNSRCDCHYLLTGFGTPSGITKEQILRKQALATPPSAFARRVA